jgi:hypothetical protein
MEQQHPTKRHFISSRKKVEPFAHYEYAEFDFWSLGLSRLPVPASTRDRQTQRFRRLQVNDESELGRLFNGQIPRIGAFKNPVHVIHGAAKGRGQAGAVCHQTSGFREFLVGKDCWQSIFAANSMIRTLLTKSVPSAKVTIALGGSSVMALKVNSKSEALRTSNA